jgi:hypothetical protein
VCDSDLSLTRLSCFALGFSFYIVYVLTWIIFPFCKLENLRERDWYGVGSLLEKVYTLTLVFLVRFYTLTFFCNDTMGISTS